MDLNKLRDAKTDDARFFQSVYKQKQEWQGFWIVSPTGKVLAQHHNYKSEATWANEVYTVLKRAKSRAGKLTVRKVAARNQRPHRGLGVKPDGGVSLAAYIRYAQSRRPTGRCVMDSITLSQREFDGFSPEGQRKGSRWLVPASVVKKFCRCLSPDSDLVTMALPKEVREVRLVGTIHDIRNRVAIITYEGKIAAVHRHLYEKGKTNRGRATILGVAEYDLDKRQMRAMAFVMDGVYHMFQPWHREPRETIAAVHWQLKK